MQHDPKFGPVFLAEKRQILKMMVDVEGKRLLTLPLFLKAAATTQPDTLLTGGGLWQMRCPNGALYCRSIPA